MHRVNTQFMMVFIISSYGYYSVNVHSAKKYLPFSYTQHWVIAMNEEYKVLAYMELIF